MIRAHKILLASLLVSACTDKPGVEARALQEEDDLVGTVWRVEDIDAGGIIDRSLVTIEILDADRISGSAGCNRYFGTLHLGATDFAVSGIGNTRMACVPALNIQEQKFLAALLEAAAYEADETFLHVFDAQGRQRIRAFRAPDDLAGAGKRSAGAADSAPALAHAFDCGDALSVSFEFVGPETIRLALPDGEHVLQRERSASGARYVAGEIMFWNKGDEALLDIGGVQHECRKSSNQLEQQYGGPQQ